MIIKRLIKALTASVLATGIFTVALAGIAIS